MDSSPPSPQIRPSQKPRLITFWSGGWVLILAIGFTLWAAITILFPIWQTGWHAAKGDGKHIDSYGFPLGNLSVPRQTLVAAVLKDEIRAIPVSLEETITPREVLLRNQNEREQGRFLTSDDRVIGVNINGASRAYPLRVLSYHEVANDVLGGVPIAITYSPLCDSAVVFDRRIDGPDSQSGDAVEFGVSGLLEDSDLVMFDRRKDSAKESLWPQLALKAVSGPLLNKHLAVLPFELTTWKHWTKEHPDTRVLEGLRTLKDLYKSEPYNTYISTDELRFPVSPIWNKNNLLKKTRIVLTSDDGGKTWRARHVTLLGQPTDAATAPGEAAPAASHSASEIKVYAYLFAWYAQHPSDTDYSALLKKAEPAA